MKKKTTTNWTVTFFLFLFLLFFLIVSFRVIYIQATGQVQGFDLEGWATRQREADTTIHAKRGTIVDRNGMALAQDLTVHRIYAIVDEDFSPDPEKRLNHVADIDQTAESLSQILEMDTVKIKEILVEGREDERFQVEFGQTGQNLSREQKLAIEALELPGIHFIDEAKRYYPNGMFASHVIGLAQADDTHDITGITGIEAQLDDQLAGINGSITYQTDNYNRRLLAANEVIEEKKDGYHVKLTIDQKVQTILEDALSQVEETFEPERITATVVNPKTGEIIALGNRPSYNPNDLGDVSNWYNDVVSTPIEPGSTMKIFTLAAAIEEGVYNPDEYYKSGTYKIPEINRPVPDYRKHWGSITFAEGFQRSSNVAMAKLVWEKIGPSTFLNYLKAFHFDQETGVDLPREQAGRIVFNYPIEQLNAAFGQGTTVSPIQLIQAATAIANDGEMMKPFVIKEITDPNTNKVISNTEPTSVGTPISKSTADQVLSAMESVVTSDTGTAHNIFHLPSYTLAGKTGTAQISGGASGYLSGRENYIFSFVGMAPSDDPKLLMYVTVKQPKLKETESGSKPVSFIFNHVMENALHYLNIQPDKEIEEDVSELIMPAVKKQATAEVVENLEGHGVKPLVVGEGSEIVGSNVQMGEKILSTQTIILVTNQPTMPNLKGESLRTVTQFADLMDLDLEVAGTGYLEKQSVAIGTELSEGHYLLADFTDFEAEEPETPTAND